MPRLQVRDGSLHVRGALWSYVTLRIHQAGCDGDPESYQGNYIEQLNVDLSAIPDHYSDRLEIQSEQVDNT